MRAAMVSRLPVARRVSRRNGGWRKHPKNLRFLLVSVFLLPLLAAPDVAAGPAPFSFNWNGTPTSPQPWIPSPVNDWDLIVHSRDRETFDQLDAVAAQHGSDCSPFPATHTVTNYADAAFVCRNHMMTALNATGYGQITFAPSQMVDFSSGTTQITFSVSTFDSAPTRDWFNVTLTPFSENLVLPAFDGIAADLQGTPANAIDVHYMGDGTFEGEWVQGFKSTPFPKVNGTPFNSFLTVSATTRTTFELDISRTHVRFGIPAFNLWWIDGDMPAYPTTQAVLQFSHDSYDPSKAPGGVGNTWHWSNIGMSAAVPFTMLRGAPNRIQHSSGHTITFPQPAPANAFLRFAALASLGSVKVSYDGGGTFSPAQVQKQCGSGCSGINDGLYVNYWTPVPAGATRVVFDANDWWGGEWRVDDPAIWSQSATGIVPPPSPTPTPTPSPTPIPTPTATPTPTPKPPIQISGAPCTVTIGGTQQTGTCTGTFQP